jgi:hypothetical protein
MELIKKALFQKRLTENELKYDSYIIFLIISNH